MESLLQCENCQNQLFEDFERGNFVCLKCGLVHNEPVFINKKRVDYDVINGNKVYRKSQTVKRVQISNDMKRILLQNRFKENYEENYRIMYANINTALNQITKAIHIPDNVRLDIINYMKLLQKKRLLKGQSTEIIAYGLCYLFLKREGKIINLNKFQDQVLLFNNRGKYRRINRAIFTLQKMIQESNLPVIKPKSQVVLYSLKLQKSLTHFNLKINGEIAFFERNYKLLKGSDPRGFIGAIVRKSAKQQNIKITQEKVAEYFGLCNITIRKWEKQIRRVEING